MMHGVQYKGIYMLPRDGAMSMVEAMALRDLLVENDYPIEHIMLYVDTADVQHAVNLCERLWYTSLN